MDPWREGLASTPDRQPIILKKHFYVSDVAKDSADSFSSRKILLGYKFSRQNDNNNGISVLCFWTSASFAAFFNFELVFRQSFQLLLH